MKLLSDTLKLNNVGWCTVDEVVGIDLVSLESPPKNKGGRPKGSSTKELDLNELAREELVGNLRLSKRLRHLAENVTTKVEANPDNVAPADLKLLDTIVKQLAVLAVQAKDIGRAQPEEKEKPEDGKDILGGLLR